MAALVAFATSYVFLWLVCLVLVCSHLSWPVRGARQVLYWALAGLMIAALLLRLAVTAR